MAHRACSTLLIVGVAHAALVMPRLAVAGGGPATDAYDGVGARPLEAHLLADAYLAHNFNDPASGDNQLRAFDQHADAPALGWLRVTLAHRPRRVGFRIDFGVGDTADAYFADDPASRDHPELSRWLSRVQQAFLTLVIPVGRGIAVDAGKFSTPVGLEDNEAWTNWSYSRSLVYTWAEPSLHTGVRATYEITGALAVSAFWLNGWNANLLDGNDMRSYALAGRWKPSERLELALVYAGGLERSPAHLESPTLTFRNLLDCYVVYRPTRWLALAASGDYGNDRASDGVHFWGFSVAARAEATRWLAAAVRGEYLADPNGFATGTAQTLGEFTGTLELRGGAGPLNLMTRIEYRHDQSTADVFQRAAGNRRYQDTLTIALLAAL